MNRPVPEVLLLLRAQVARIQVTGASTLQQQGHLTASLEPVRASLAERAADRELHQRRGQAGDCCEPPRPGTVKPGDRAEQPPGVRMLRIVEQVALGALL